MAYVNDPKDVEASIGKRVVNIKWQDECDCADLVFEDGSTLVLHQRRSGKDKSEARDGERALLDMLEQMHDTVNGVRNRMDSLAEYFSRYAATDRDEGGLFTRCTAMSKSILSHLLEAQREYHKLVILVRNAMSLYALVQSFEPGVLRKKGTSSAEG